MRRRAAHAHEAGVAELDHPSSTLYFRVDDIHASRERLSARGVSFEVESHLTARMSDYELWMAFSGIPTAICTAS